MLEQNQPPRLDKTGPRYGLCGVTTLADFLRSPAPPRSCDQCRCLVDPDQGIPTGEWTYLHHYVCHCGARWSIAWTGEKVA